MNQLVCSSNGSIEDVQLYHNPAADLGQWFLPIVLTAEEQVDPMQAVGAFFRLYPLPEARQRIERWREAILSEPTWPVVETGVHVEFCLAMCRLVLCAGLLRSYETPLWALLILEGKDGGASAPPTVLYCPRGVVDASDYYPQHLSRAEWSAPGLVLRQLLETRESGVWLSELYELLTYSLSDCTPDLVDDDCDVAGMMVGLLRMVEAMHLMWVWRVLKGG